VAPSAIKQPESDARKPTLKVAPLAVQPARTSITLAVASARDMAVEKPFTAAIPGRQGANPGRSKMVYSNHLSQQTQTLTTPVPNQRYEEPEVRRQLHGLSGTFGLVRELQVSDGDDAIDYCYETNLSELGFLPLQAWAIESP
jgi:hypothetical protein